MDCCSQLPLVQQFAQLPLLIPDGVAVKKCRLLLQPVDLGLLFLQLSVERHIAEGPARQQQRTEQRQHRSSGPAAAGLFLRRRCGLRLSGPRLAFDGRLHSPDGPQRGPHLPRLN